MDGGSGLDCQPNWFWGQKTTLPLWVECNSERSWRTWNAIVALYVERLDGAGTLFDSRFRDTGHTSRSTPLRNTKGSKMKLRIWSSVFTVAAALLTSSFAQAAKYSFANIRDWTPRYGNWGGWGYSNGQEGGDPFSLVLVEAPVDRMDAMFQVHDRALATADAIYRPLYLSVPLSNNRALISLKRRYVNQWRQAYRVAHQQLIRSVKSLPSLVVDCHTGTDNWGGVNIPWDVSHRMLFKNIVRGIRFVGVMPSIPYFRLPPNIHSSET